MNKGLKITLIALGVGVAIAVPTILILNKRKKDREREQKEREQQLIEGEQSVQSGADESTNSVVPKRNRNNEIINPFSEVKGRVLYPAKNSNNPSDGYSGASGNANLRSSAEVNTGYWNNLIKEYTSSESIGKVIAEARDDLSPSMRWFKVKMTKPCCGILSDYKEGWVRADVVTFKKYAKTKSAFDGSMIQKYDISYPLGAEVFPHPNWMLPNSGTGINQSYDIEDVIEGL